MYLEIQKHISKKGKATYYGVFRHSYYSKGKVLHKDLGRLSSCSLEELLILKNALANKSAGEEHDMRAETSREFGAVFAAYKTVCDLDLDKILYSRKEPWRQRVIAMVIGKLVYQGSKLGLVNIWENTSLGDLVGLGSARPDVDDFYEAMDHLLLRQDAIEKQLSSRHLKEGCLILYDITSSYFEGDDAQLAKYGYSRDGRPSKKQIVLGLITSSDGCPVSIEVFEGNTSDQTTVKGQIEKIKNKFGIKEIVFVGDRGMVIRKHIEEADKEFCKYITALTHREIKKLREMNYIQYDLFDEKNIVEILYNEDPSTRLILCKNPQRASEETETRKALISKTRDKFERITKSIEKGKLKSRDKIVERITRWRNRWLVGKFFDYKITDDCKLEWSVKDDKIIEEEKLDGCYIIETNVSSSKLTKEEVLSSYKSLAHVEKAWRNLKTVQLDLRPIWHRKEDRIRAHALICMLAYYIQWHITQKLAPLIRSKNGSGKNYTMSFNSVMSKLKTLQENTYNIKGKKIKATTRASEEHQEIFAALEIKYD